MGYLQWRWGIQSAMNTSIVRDTKTSHFTVALQVRILLLYGGDSTAVLSGRSLSFSVPAVFWLENRG